MRSIAEISILKMYSYKPVWQPREWVFGEMIIQQAKPCCSWSHTVEILEKQYASLLWFVAFVYLLGEIGSVFAVLRTILQGRIPSSKLGKLSTRSRWECIRPLVEEVCKPVWQTLFVNPYVMIQMNTAKMWCLQLILRRFDIAQKARQMRWLMNKCCSVDCQWQSWLMLWVILMLDAVKVSLSL